MIVCNRTQLAFATKVTAREPRKPEMVVCVKAVYRLTPGQISEPIVEGRDSMITGDVFPEDDDDRVGSLEYASDLADFKPSGELLVRATCHAPKGKPVLECPVRIGLGPLSKELLVSGPRVWVDDPLGSHPSDTITFTRSRIDYEVAAGGPGVAENPAGRGGESADLPSIEYPDDRVRSRGARAKVAGFGPIASSWEPRASLIGERYGADYQKNRAPFYAEDFSFRFFQSAPIDQQIEGYWKGDEELRLENLHPVSASLVTRLPAIRVRAFVRDTAGRFRPVAMVLDTVSVDVDKETVALVFRGLDRVRETDLADVKSLLIARETLGEKKTEAEYRAMLDAFEADPIGIVEARAAVDREIDGLLSGVSDEGGDLAKLPSALREKLDTSGMPDVLKRQVAARLEAAEKATAAGAKSAGTADPSIPQGTMLEQLERLAGAEVDEPPIPLTSKPGAIPSTGLRKQVRRTMEQWAKARRGVATERLDEDQRAMFARMEAFPHDPDHPKLDPEYSVPEPLSKDPPGPGANLVDRDLTGRDLRGVNLVGANLAGAILTRADLRGADLATANLRGAVVFKTQLEGANLEGADLTRANFAKASAPRARFIGATLAETFFEEADLEGADLSRVVGDFTVFVRAHLAKAKGDGARILRPDLEEAVLTGSSWVEASLKGAIAPRVMADAVDFRRADLSAFSGVSASLRGAKLEGATLDRAYLFGAVLDDADLALASLKGAIFETASLRNAVLYGANARDARFGRSDLSFVDARRTNLMSADLGRTKMERARFRDASLYGANLVEAAGEGVDFTGALLVRAVSSSGLVLEAGDR